MASTFLVRFALGTALALYLARHGLKRKSLSLSGAIVAFCVGLIAFLTAYRFGVLLILFYYTSSKLTKVNETKKSSLEDDFKMVRLVFTNIHRASSFHRYRRLRSQPMHKLFAQGGQRGAVQVLANSALATLLCLLYVYIVGEDGHVWVSTSRLGSTEFLFREHVGGLIW
mgnify:CR=1 FL=1